MKLSNQKFLSSSALLLGLVLFLVINVINNSLLPAVKLDLTQDKIYTLSQGTKQILNELDEPITLRFYFSKKLSAQNPFLNSFANRVKELLQQYQSLAKSKIILEIIDPVPFTESEDEAVNYGLQGVPVDSEGNELYFGLVGTNSTTTEKTISFFQPKREPYLEYDITKLIYSLANPAAQTVGVISSAPMQGQEMQFLQGGSPWVVWEQMTQQYDMHILANDIKEIPEETKVLMLVNPDEISPATEYAIDQFVMRGGHVLAFIDPHMEVNSLSGSMQVTNSATMKNLLASWGVKLDLEHVVAARELAKSVRYSNEGKELTTRYPLWIDVTQDNLDSNDIITNEISRLTFATPGSLQPLENATTRFSPLVSLNEDAMLVETNKLEEYKNDPRQLLNDYQPAGQKQILAARITGTVKSAFTEVPIEMDATKHIAETGESNIIVIADADMLYDHFWVNVQNFLGNRLAIPSSGNGNFVLSAIDNLSGSNALISIRNRGTYARHFDKIREIELESQQRHQAAEESLLHQLNLTKQKLAELDNQKREGNALSLSVKQQQEEEIFRQELVQTRKQLRDVRHALNRDIENLEIKIKFFSIAFIPVLIMLGGVFYWVSIMRQTKQAKTAV